MCNAKCTARKKVIKNDLTARQKTKNHLVGKFQFSYLILIRNTLSNGFAIKGVPIEGTLNGRAVTVGNFAHPLGVGLEKPTDGVAQTRCL